MPVLRKCGLEGRGAGGGERDERRGQGGEYHVVDCNFSIIVLLFLYLIKTLIHRLRKDLMVRQFKTLLTV